MSNYRERLVSRLIINRLTRKYHCSIEDLLTGKYCILGKGVRKQVKRMIGEEKKPTDFTNINEGSRR